MEQPEYAIDGTSEPNTRLNIDDFSTNDEYKIQWGLYLRALNVLQLAPPTDFKGYYRVAAIHGAPIMTWPEGIADPDKTIYCAHGISTFLPWHRPYLLLLEQRIVEEAVALAALAPVGLRQLYTQEALKIRQPFWDWADIPALPAAALEREAQVIIPEVDPSNPSTIRNPLHSYIHTGDPVGEPTYRDPTEAVNDSLYWSDLRGIIYHTLTLKQGYGPFSNKRFSPPGQSIENPHDSVHSSIGASMASVLRAAFDPIFWLHHATIDRFYAFWQIINPDERYQENNAGENTVDKPLAPFARSNPHGAWTSRMIQRTDSAHIPNTFLFGVQYPEALAAWTDVERQTSVMAAIVRLYGPRAIAKGPRSVYPPGAVPQRDRVTIPGYPADLPDESGIRREWRVMIEVNNDLMEGNFTIFVFLGEAGEVPGEWGRGPSTAGSFTTFKAPLASCGNCQAAQGRPIYGSVYLTDRMFDLLPIGSRLEDQREVVAWLTGKLDWRIRKEDGTEFQLAPGGAADLHVGVESFMEAYAPVGEDGTPRDCDLARILGVTFDRVRHPAITSGKAHKGGDTQ